MRIISSIWLVCLASVAGAQSAQTAPHVLDGGTVEVLESIAISPIVHAPFSGLLRTEWVRGLSDGGTITVMNQRRIARDGRGRIYQERWYLAPKNGKTESEMSHVQISDPDKHEFYTCYMWRNACELSSYIPPMGMLFQPDMQWTGPLKDGVSEHQVEKLGMQNIDGVQTVGTRESTTLNAWVIGNDRPIKVAREFWYSADLGFNLVSKLSDPRFGTQIFTMTDLSLGEPDAGLFKPPAGFKIIDVRRDPGVPPSY